MFDFYTSSRNIGQQLVMRLWLWAGAVAGLPITLAMGYRFCATFFTATYDQTAGHAATFLVALFLWLFCCWILKMDLERLRDDDDTRFPGADEDFEAHQAQRLREVERMYANDPGARRF